MKSLRYCAFASVVFLSVAWSVQAQAQGTAAPTATLWRFLGIPQTASAFRNGLVNRRGNFPGLERRPPLKPIAAMENLESPNPAIKAAAEIKQAEDLKLQKIKAIKYLASIGCSCYDKDGKITEALLAATDDCTPDVRLAVVEAIEDNVNNECCQKCGTKSCCNEKTTKRLSEMAYERDDSGCCLEPSAEIRRAAARVLAKCCPNRVPPGMIEEDVESYEPSEEDESPELIPAADEPEIQGEAPLQESEVQGEARDDRPQDDVLDLQDRPADGNDESLDTGEADAEQLILSQPAPGRPIEFSLRDIRVDEPATGHSVRLVPVRIEPVRIEPVSRKPVTLKKIPIQPVAERIDGLPVPNSRPIELTPATNGQEARRTAPARQPLVSISIPESIPGQSSLSNSNRKVLRVVSTESIDPPRQANHVTQDHPAVISVVSTGPPVTPRSPTVDRKSDKQIIAQSSTSEVRFDQPVDLKSQLTTLAEIVFIDHSTGKLMLSSNRVRSVQAANVGDICRFRGGLVSIVGRSDFQENKKSGFNAVINDPAMLGNVRVGDRVVCPR